MLKAQLVVKAAIGSALLTLAIVAVTLLYLMFSTGRDEFGERKAFFGSLVFETVEKGNGVTGITTGVDDPIPIIILFLVITLLFTMVQFIYRGLKQRRDQLLNDIPRI